MDPTPPTLGHLRLYRILFSSDTEWRQRPLQLSPFLLSAHRSVSRNPRGKARQAREDDDDDYGSEDDDNFPVFFDTPSSLLPPKGDTSPQSSSSSARGPACGICPHLLSSGRRGQQASSNSAPPQRSGEHTHSQQQLSRVPQLENLARDAIIRTLRELPIELLATEYNRRADIFIRNQPTLLAGVVEDTDTSPIIGISPIANLVLGGVLPFHIRSISNTVLYEELIRRALAPGDDGLRFTREFQTHVLLPILSLLAIKRDSVSANSAAGPIFDFVRGHQSKAKISDRVRITDIYPFIVPIVGNHNKDRFIHRLPAEITGSERCCEHVPDRRRRPPETVYVRGVRDEQAYHVLSQRLTTDGRLGPSPEVYYHTEDMEHSTVITACSAMALLASPTPQMSAGAERAGTAPTDPTLSVVPMQNADNSCLISHGDDVSISSTVPASCANSMASMAGQNLSSNAPDHNASQSAWASPILLAEKKGGKVRFCIDYRRLNAATKRDAYPLPRMDEILTVLRGSVMCQENDPPPGVLL